MTTRIDLLLKQPSILTILFFGLVLIGCNPSAKQNDDFEEIGRLEVYDNELLKIIDADAKAEIIANGFEWSEGPLWVKSNQMLIFSDIPKNIIYKWTEAEGLSEYLKPSGTTEGIASGEEGSNGLIQDSSGNLILCQHGNRQMARMKAILNDPKPIFESIADRYNGLRFNSPNDAAYAPNGDLYFTDPPYGLASETLREIDFQGVYKVDTAGNVSLVTDQLTRPNGIAVINNGTRLIVANSDSDLPNWYVIDISEDGFSSPKIYYNLEGYDKNILGLPDGLKVDKNGNVIATGPGGIHFFNSSGKLLGKYHLPKASSNCTFSDDGRILYITNHDKLVRLKFK